MNALTDKLNQLNPALLNNLKDTIAEVELLLGKYDSNFPTYTDHSIKHTLEVFDLASQILVDDELDNLSEDEIYILAMASLLHDIGMCIPPIAIIELFKEIHFKGQEEGQIITEEQIRDVHHELSYHFILKEWELLKIPNLKYAEAIAIVSKGHRKVQLDNIDEYKPRFFVKNGRGFVCLPYLACILRIADELDVTNIRTPKLLTKYYMPNNKKSVEEWEKHISTTQINFTEESVIYEVSCADHSSLAALEEQFDKIQSTINNCQKVYSDINKYLCHFYWFNIGTSKSCTYVVLVVL